MDSTPHPDRKIQKGSDPLTDPLTGKGWRRWAGLVLGLAVLTAVPLAGLIYSLHMPGKTHRGPLPPLSMEEAQIRDRLATHVQTLAGHIGERNLWRYDSLLAAAHYIERTLADLGYVPTDEPFESRGRPVRNVIAERRGSTQSEQIVLVGAHYDSVQGSPGANDNASGVAALLELARLLADRPLPRTVRLVAFVNEEAPFSYSPEMGSLVHAQGARARGESIRAMLSLETIGYYSEVPGSQRYPFPLSLFYPDTANFIGFVGNLGSRALVRRALGEFRQTTAFPSEGAAVPERLPGVGWSDHWSFWRVGYPAIMVTDTAFYRYPHYHSADDTPERIDYERTARVVSGLAGVIASLAAKD
jgi:Peptidase family M28